MKLEELVARVFQARNTAHREHLKTDSYSKHMALSSFYESIIPAIDEIIEVSQGRKDLIGDFIIKDHSPKDITAYLIAEAAWIENNRSEIGNCPAALNLIDGLSGIYYQTIYKLRNLN